MIFGEKTRYWATRPKRRPTGFPAAVVWEGGAAPAEEMVRATLRRSKARPARLKAHP